MNNEIPRKIQIDKMIPEELAIRDALILVEELGAHPILTHAVVLLKSAQDKVAEWYDTTNL